MHFAPPEKVQLCTAESLTRVQLPPGAELVVATADLKDAFYHFALPIPLRTYFGMRPLRAGELGLDVLGDETLSPGTLLFPRLKVLPMGWSHALWWCQSIHQSVVASIGATAETCLHDRAAVPDHACFHLEYVDNYVVLGTNREAVESLATAGANALRSKGLVVHEEDIASGANQDEGPRLAD